MMYEQRNIYRRICREKSAQYRRNEADNLLKLSKTDTKAFWRKIRGKRVNEGMEGCDFYNHFKNLADIESRVGEEGLKEVEEGGERNECRKSEVLDQPIGIIELESVIKSLKKK